MLSSKDLYDALGRRDWNTARSLLRRSDDRALVEYTNDCNDNALHEACSYKAPSDIIQTMLNTSTRAPLQQNKYGFTPLYLAIYGSSDDIITRLIKACPRAASIADIAGSTPLHCAILKDKSSILIGSLLAANPSAATAANVNGDTPLYYLFRNWNVPLRNTLDAIGGEKNDIRDVILRYGRTEKLVGDLYQTFLLLLQAAIHGSIEHNPDSPFRPLCAAIYYPSCPWSFVNMILRIEPMQASQWDREGNLPIHVAAAATSSFDGELYKCDRCRHNLQNTSWYQQHKEYSNANYCLNCFQGLDEESEEDFDFDRKEFKLVHSVDKIPAVIRDLLKTNPKFAKIPDSKGRLPLQIAIEKEKLLKKNLETIFQSAPEALSTRDIQTHLYPFMSGAVPYSEAAKRKKGTPSDQFLGKFTSCYSLLMENPVLVQPGIPARGSKRNQDGDAQG